MKSLISIFILSQSLTLGSAVAQDLDIVRDLYIGQVKESQALMVSGHADHTEVNKKSIKVLVWNIKKAEMNDWQREFVAYSKDRDFILIQEAYWKRMFELTISLFKNYRWDMGISFLNKNDWAFTGTMIGSRFEPRESYVKHSLDLEPLVHTPKSMTFAKYPITGKREELLVVSVHAINFTIPVTFRRNMKIASEEISKHNGPVLFAGDFNTWSEGRLRHLFRVTKELGLKTVEFKNGDKRITFSDNYLDHAFVRGLRVKEAEVVADSKGSDHRPLLLDLEFE